MIPIALQESEHEYGVPSDTPNEQLGQGTPGIRRPEGQDGGEHVDQETVLVASERAHEGDQLGEAAQHVIGAGGSGGECRCPTNILPINIYQFQKEPQSTRSSTLLPFPMMSQRNPQTDPTFLGPSQGVVPITIWKQTGPTRPWREMRMAPGLHNLYFKRNAKVKDFPRWKQRVVAVGTGKTLQVSVSDPLHGEGCSCESLWPFPSEENTSAARKEESKPAEVSRGACRNQGVVRSMLTSCREELQRHGAWVTHRFRRGGRRWVQSSQSRPRGHLRRLYRSRSPLTTPCSKFFD